MTKMETEEQVPERPENLTISLHDSGSKNP